MIIAERLLNSWLREAKAGDVLVYARATYLQPNVVTRRLYDLAISGHVCLTRTRTLHGAGMENFHYAAKRLAKPFSGRDPADTDPASGTAKPGQRETARTGLIREIEPQVRSLIAEGMERNAHKIARTLGLYDRYPVAVVLERMAA